jgi:hypothetical protein
MTTHIGIDPGVNGAYARIEEGENLEVMGAPLPTFWITVKTKNGIKRRQKYDIKAMYTIFKNVGVARFTIEKQIPMPMERTIETPTGTKTMKQGATSVFTTGCGYGFIRGVVYGMGVTPEVVHPKTWQKEFFKRDTSKTTKEQALDALKALYPNVDLFATERSKKVHDGIVDAILIAEWGRRKTKGELKK